MRHLLPCAASVSGYFRLPFYNVDARILFPNESFVNILRRILSLFTYLFSCFVYFRESSCGHTLLHTKVASLLSSLFRFSFYYAEHETYLILNITHRTLPSALYAFPQPARPFLTGLKEYTPLLHAPQDLGPIRTPCCTFFYPALPHVAWLSSSLCALLSSSLCKKMPPRSECISLNGIKIRRKRKPLAPYLIRFHPWLHRWCAVGVTVLRSISPG